MGRSEMLTSVVKCSEDLRNRVSIIIRRYTDHTKFYCFFHILLFLLWFIVYMVVCFACFYLILCIMYSFFYLMLIGPCIILQLSFFLCLFILIVMMSRSKYCVSLYCSVYCLCVNVYCTTASGCQPNCS